MEWCLARFEGLMARTVHGWGRSKGKDGRMNGRRITACAGYVSPRWPPRPAYPLGKKIRLPGRAKSPWLLVRPGKVNFTRGGGKSGLRDAFKLTPASGETRFFVAAEQRNSQSPAEGRRRPRAVLAQRSAWLGDKALLTGHSRRRGYSLPSSFALRIRAAMAEMMSTAMGTM